MTLSAWLSRNDIRLYVDRMRLRDGRNEFNAQADSPVSAKVFREAVAEHCRFWKCSRRRRRHRTGLLNDAQWNRVERVAKELRSDLRGLSLYEATEVMRTRVSCSESILLGLPSRFHVWKHDR